MLVEEYSVQREQQMYSPDGEYAYYCKKNTQKASMTAAHRVKGRVVKD